MIYIMADSTYSVYETISHSAHCHTGNRSYSQYFPSVMHLINLWQYLYILTFKQNTCLHKAIGLCFTGNDTTAGQTKELLTAFLVDNNCCCSLLGISTVESSSLTNVLGSPFSSKFDLHCKGMCK